MKVVQVTTELNPGGAERVVVDLSRGLLERGHEVHVVSLRPLPRESPILAELREASIPIHALDLYKHNPWRILALDPIVDCIAPDIVHTHLFHPNIAGRFVRKRGFKLVNTVHVAEPRTTKRWLLLLDRLTRFRFDVQTAVSWAVQAHHAKKIGVAPETMPVIYNGSRSPRRLTPQDIETLRREWGVADCSWVMGSVGRLDPQKGYDILLGLLPALAGHVPSGETWGLILLGSGPQEETLHELARGVPPCIRVRLPGFRKDAGSCAGAFDLFVMPSRFEGFGLSLVEAMAHGVPVLASNVDSLPEILEGYEAGVLVDFSDLERDSIVDAIRRMRQVGPGPPRTPLSIDSMVDEYVRLYRSLMG